MQGHVLAAGIWNQPGDTAYPIASFTYLIVYKDLGTKKDVTGDQARALGEFLWWATHDGQALAPALDYAPLSTGVQSRTETALRALTFRGNPVLTPAR
jgi:phosphate transport system substrate-binding protein